MLQQKMQNFLGRNINAICPNNFHDADANHCAHFVSHALGIRSSFNCREFKGGSGAPANIRVHEVFALCPKVGKKADMDLSKDQLVFVTLAQNVTIATKTMINIPQKHIGVYAGGMVYHYSNGGDKVVKQTLDEWETTFQNAYSGVQGIFFGHFPAGVDIDAAAPVSSASPATAPAATTTLTATATPDADASGFKLEKTGKVWSATRKGEADSFLVGKEIMDSANGYFGLFVPAGSYYGPTYSGADYEARFGQYAYLLELTGHGESKNRFNLINTYDRAKFTFGFYQLAAHTPGDNLILLMRDLVSAGVTQDYFPDLKIVNGALHRMDAGGGSTNLETPQPTGPDDEQQLQRFMDYLNPQRQVLDKEEVLNSARFMHMANTKQAARDIQVERAAKILEGKMARYGQRYNLDGKSDLICAIIADIHHQGRAKVAKVKLALASSDPINQLIDINARYATRAADLREVIARLKQAGKIGQLKYNAASNTFV